MATSFKHQNLKDITTDYSPEPNTLEILIIVLLLSFVLFEILIL